MKFRVNVEKSLFSFGSVEVDCETKDQAIDLIEDRIDNGELLTNMVDWTGLQYEDMSFKTTGSVIQLR